MALWTPKEKIAEDDEYNLSAERYRVVVDYSNAKWPMVKLREVCDIKRGTSITKKQLREGKIPVIAGGRGPAYYHDEANRIGEIITISGSGAYAGFVNYFQQQIFASDCSTVQSYDKEKALTKFVYFCLHYKQEEIYQLRTGMAQPHVYPKNIQGFSIPLPPLAVQEEIVAELDGYQRVIDGARLAIANWKPTININPDWPKVKLGEVCSLAGEYGSGSKKIAFNGEVRYVRITDIDDAGRLKEDGIVSPSLIEPKYFLKTGDVLLARSGSVGRAYLHKKDSGTYQFAGYLIRYRADSSQLLPDFLFHITKSELWKNWIKEQSKTATLTNINAKQFSGFRFPLPPLIEQQRIVAEIGEEEKAITACRHLIDSHGEKIRAKIAGLWGETPDSPLLA